VAELPDDEEKARLAADPIYRLEQGQASKARAVANKGRMERLREDASRKWEADNGYELNKALRAQLRDGKRMVAQEKQVRCAGLPGLAGSGGRRRAGAAGCAGREPGGAGARLPRRPSRRAALCPRGRSGCWAGPGPDA
jgi:hypothetical protein